MTTPYERPPAELNTYRFLRMAMPVIVVALGISIVWERTSVSCWKTSISAYYFTSVHTVFVGALCALGTSLIVYQGSSDTEDAILNFSGFLAFVVAMVPTDPDTASCGGATFPDVSAGYANNVRALFATAVLVEGFRLFLKYRGTPGQPKPKPNTETKLALGVAYVMTIAGGIAFLTHRDWFRDNGHTFSAVTMFVGIIVVMLLNAFDVRSLPDSPRRRRFLNAYRIVAAAMTASLLASVVAHLALKGNHLVIAVEALVILSFVAYWIVQTIELKGVKDRNELA
jgi:hypothetical protein